MAKVCLFLNGCFCSCLNCFFIVAAHTAAFALCSGGFFIFSSSCRIGLFYLALCEAFCHCGANGIED